MSLFSEAIKSLTDQPFICSGGVPKNKTEYLERVKIVKSEDELTSQGLPDWQLVKNKQEQLKLEYDALQYQRDRIQKYPNTNDLIVALWEKVVEGRSESADALEVKRQEVKTAHPKPE